MVSSSAENALRQILQEPKNEQDNPLLSKIYINKSLLINKLTPLNFKNIIDGGELPIKQNVDVKAKEDLLNLVSYRDNVGEFCWYVYTAIFVISIVQYNVVNLTCNKSQATLQSDLAAYNSNTGQTTTSGGTV